LSLPKFQGGRGSRRASRCVDRRVCPDSRREKKKWPATEGKGALGRRHSAITNYRATRANRSREILCSLVCLPGLARENVGWVLEPADSRSAVGPCPDQPSKMGPARTARTKAETLDRDSGENARTARSWAKTGGRLPGVSLLNQASLAVTNGCYGTTTIRSH